MDPRQASLATERWRGVREALDAAIAADPAERFRILDSLRSRDAHLRRDVESLLQLDETRGLGETHTDSVTQALPPAGLRSGDAVGPFVVVRPLGTGGMGEVYLARDDRLLREVALKRLRLERRGTTGAAERLLREAQVLGRLNHPAIATIYDVLLHGGDTFIVMECVPGEPLAARIGRDRFSLTQAVDIGLQISGALIHAHEHGIVHRDLKPANIMLARNGRVKVLDFGIARLLEPADRESTPLTTAAGVVMGTPGYMAPEQLLGAEVDGRADIYSAGVVLYELVAGRRLFSQRTPLDLIHAMVAQPLPPLHHPDQELPASLVETVTRALHPEPELRYASAADLQQDLERAAADLRKGEPRGFDAVGGLRSPKTAAWGLVAALLVAGIVALGGLRGGGEEPRPAIRAAPDSAALADYRQGQRYLERADVPENLDYAIQLFERAIAKDPNLALGHAGLGEALWAKYRRTSDAVYIEQSRRALLEALRLDPQAFQVRYALAVLYEGTGRSRQAAEELQQILRTHPEHDAAHRLHGRILLGSGDVAGGFQALRRAVELRPDSAANHMQLALGYYSAGQYADAVPAFTRATELEPDNAAAHQSLGTSEHMLGRLDNALRHYQRANALRPTATAWSNIGTIHFAQGKLEEAIAAYEQALKLNAKSASTYVNLGDARRSLGDEAAARHAYESAATLCTEQLKSNPNDGARLSILAMAEAKLGRAADAERHAQQAVTLRPTDTQVLYNAAVALELAGQRADAIPMLAKALERGYSKELLKLDRDLSELRSLPEVERLLRR